MKKLISLSSISLLSFGLSLSLSSNSMASNCFDLVKQGGNLTCHIEGSLWRGAEMYSKVVSEKAHKGIKVTEVGFIFEAKLKKATPAVYVLELGLYEGFYGNTLSIPIHREVNYGHGCEYQIKNLDLDNQIQVDCKINR